MAATSFSQSAVALTAGAAHRTPVRTGAAPAPAHAHATRRLPSRLSAAATDAPVKVSDTSLAAGLARAGSTAWAEAQALQQAPAAAAAAAPKRVVLEDPNELKSTLEHRLWVGSATLLMGVTLAEGLSQVDGAGTAAAAGAAALAAYYMADVGTAFYHWAVDNYGDANTPVFGGQIAAFQGHHQRPWTITEREFCNNVHKLFKPATPFAGGLLLTSLVGAPVWWDVWSSAFLFLCCMSQQLHAWSHMKKSELHPAIVSLQDAGLLISRKDHGAHHKSPFDEKYSIVSGWCNPLLDGDAPENSFYHKLERFIHATTGVEPRCWQEPDYTWQEQQRPGTAP